MYIQCIMKHIQLNCTLFTKFEVNEIEHPQIDIPPINHSQIILLTRKVIHGNTKLIFSLQACQSINQCIDLLSYVKSLNIFLPLFYFLLKKVLFPIYLLCNCKTLYIHLQSQILNKKGSQDYKADCDEALPFRDNLDHKKIYMKIIVNDLLYQNIRKSSMV